MHSEDMETRSPTTTSSTPYALLSVKDVEAQFRRLVEAMPGVSVYYALKANHHPSIVGALHRQGSGFEVASLGELEHLLNIGVAARDVVFSNPVKVPAHIRRSYELGVSRYAFDCATEVEKLAKNAPGSLVDLRLAVPDAGSTFPLSEKFGCSEDDALDLIQLATQKGLRLAGVAFHVGSQCTNAKSWAAAIEVVGRVLKAAAGLGFRAEHVNIGGGFPVAYAEPVPSIEEIGDVVADSALRFLPYEVSLLAEPGRFLAAPSLRIVTSVIGREVRGGRNWIFLDMGVFQGLLECLEYEDWNYPMAVPGRPEGALNHFVVTGPTCDALDTIARNALLPDETTVGDEVLIDLVGAYSLEYGSRFNGFQPPQVFEQTGEE